MKKMILLFVTTISSIILNAQLLSWSPNFPVENDAAQTFVITVDAAKGNAGLLNYSNTGDVYVHIGVITNLSTSSSDWKYVKTTWASTDAAAKASYIGNNKYQFTINGSLKNFFGITNATESIQKIALLFRNGNGTLKQTNSDGSDMYIPVYSNTLAVRINEPAREPRFVPVAEVQNWTVGTTFTISAVSNNASTLKVYHNGTLLNTATTAQSITATGTVTAQGMQQIIAEAFDGTTTKYDTVNVFVAPTSSPVVALPAGLRDGINYESNGTAVTLVLTAPGKSQVSVIGDFTNWADDLNYIMNKTPDGKKFWLRISGLTAGVEYGYQYKVDGVLKIADPYTEKVLDPNNDQYIPATTYPNLKTYPTGKTTGIVSVLQTAMPAYTWSINNFNRPDKRSLVIYELLVRDFVATHDWKTLKDTLGYLKSLGINAIELMPFNEFEGNNSWGYNPDFYFAPDKYYGPKNTLKAFVDACHANGMAVIMDIALNHSFGSSPMVQLYFDAAANKPAANNPWFNPDAKHPFNVGYDMNHESADTKYFVGRVTEHWLQEYKIDGFRFDLSKGFTQKNSGTDVALWGQYDASRVAIWKGYYDTVQNKSPNAYVVLEHFADNSEEKELSDYGMMLWGNLNDSYAQASMGYTDRSNFEWGISTVRGWTKPHVVTYMESHDEERIMYKNINYGNASGSYNIKDTATALKRVELDAAFFFTIPGPKMLWQFEELGYDYPINYCTNGTVNNNCRLDPKPIRWDYLADARRKHVYEEFKNLIALRFHPWYKDAFTSNRIEESLGSTFKWMKVTTDTSNLLVVGNFDVAATTGSVTFQNTGVWYDYLNNTTFTATGTAQTLSLAPGEFHVYVNRNVNNVTATPVSNVVTDADALSVQLFPNPITTAFTVSVNMPQSSAVRINLVDMHGRIIGTLQQSFLAKGAHQLTFNRKNFMAAGGMYYLQVATKTTTKTIQIILQ